MAYMASEIQSLEEINYKGRFKMILVIIFAIFLFFMSFLSFFPIGDKLKSVLKTTLQASNCNLDYRELGLEFLLPKIVVSDLTLPAGCFNRNGEPVKLSFVKLNYQLISFSPFGLPFRLDTEIDGQPLSLYYVQGFGKQTIRMKDQTLVLSRLKNLIGDKFKVAGTVVMDMAMTMEKNRLSSFHLRTASKNFQIPSQNLQGFNLPPLKINQFFLEANSDAAPRVNISKFILGDTSSPIRANFKGKLTLMEGQASFSPLDLTGEVTFSEDFKQAVPLIDMMFQSFSQKDGFYQVRIGGTLGAPKPAPM
jgi:type II secretion system protein N